MLRFKYPDGALPHVLAFIYALGGYAGGLYLSGLHSIAANIVGTLLLGHAMVIAAYMVHECAHNTVFLRNEDNTRAGVLLNWLTGACYGSYEGIRRKHFRHHVDQADVVAFDYRPRLQAHPLLLRVMTLAEWAYIPAVDIYMHLMVMLLPFTLESRKNLRGRVIAIFLLRTAFFAALALWSPRVLLCYAIAWGLMVTVLGFMDCFQHTYDIFATLEDGSNPKAAHYDKGFEQRNTYTNVHSLQHPWVNLLTLNFGYHNAHHVKPAAPWYRLPALHAELFPDITYQVIPFRHQLLAYHRYRTQRLLNADPADMNIMQDQGLSFVGVHGVSFLTAH